MDIRLAEKEDIQAIMNILEERCNWFKENGIDQWANSLIRKNN